MITDFFISVALVNQATVTQSVTGGPIKTFAERIAALSCRLAKKSIREMDDFGKMTIRGIWRLYCEATTVNKTITETDRIVLGGITYEVTGIYNPGLLDRHLEIDLAEIR